MKKIAEREDLIQMLVNDEARRLNADLDQRCDERTRELHEMQTEVEAFDHCISHDLRAPVINIGGFADLLQKRLGDTLDPESRRFLDTIAASACQLGRMVDDLAGLTRVGRAEVYRISFNLETMVQHVIEELRSKAPERNLLWSVGELPVVHADPTMLREVISKTSPTLSFCLTSEMSHAAVNVGSQVILRKLKAIVRVGSGVLFGGTQRQKTSELKSLSSGESARRILISLGLLDSMTAELQNRKARLFFSMSETEPNNLNRCVAHDQAYYIPNKDASRSHAWPNVKDEPRPQLARLLRQQET